MQKTKKVVSEDLAYRKKFKRRRTILLVLDAAWLTVFVTVLILLVVKL